MKKITGLKKKRFPSGMEYSHNVISGGMRHYGLLASFYRRGIQ